MKYLITALGMFVLYLVGLLFLPDNYLLVLSIIALIILSRVEKAFVVQNKFNSSRKSDLLTPNLSNGNGNGHVNVNGNGHVNVNSNDHVNGNGNSHVNGNGKKLNKKVKSIFKKTINKVA